MKKVVLFKKTYGVKSQFRKDHDEMSFFAYFMDDQSLIVAG
ncbi:hypothetical protein [Moraxella porci]|nr:hypothetical protein [Moraxella porci]MDH2274608.1 hypothetical protein [Moraxella porci]